MDPLLQNGPFNYGTHWGIAPYEHVWGVGPYWNPYHGSPTFAGLGALGDTGTPVGPAGYQVGYPVARMSGLGWLGADPTTAAPDDLGQTSILHVLVAAGIGGAVAGFASWDLSRAATGAAALAGLAAGFDGVTGLTGGKPTLGLALLAVGALGVFAAYTSARHWNTRYVRRHAGVPG